MSSWKSEPLYCAILHEVQALWEDLEGSGRPMLLRIEERTAPPWDGSPALGQLRNVWVFDAHGPRLAPILRHEEHDFGPTTGEFSRFGLVRFAASRDGGTLTFEYRLGPSIMGEIHYGIEREGPALRLVAHSGTLST